MSDMQGSGSYPITMNADSDSNTIQRYTYSEVSSNNRMTYELVNSGNGGCSTGSGSNSGWLNIYEGPHWCRLRCMSQGSGYSWFTISSDNNCRCHSQYCSGNGDTTQTSYRIHNGLIPMFGGGGGCNDYEMGGHFKRRRGYLTGHRRRYGYDRRRGTYACLLYTSPSPRDS